MSLLFSDSKKEKTPEKSLLGEKLLPFKAVMCRSCGKIQVTTGEEMFRCRECNKVSYYRIKGRWNVRLKDFVSFEAAMMAAKRWAMEEGLNNKTSYLAFDDGML